jgi:phospholipid/cholesterol/gamma-HCH transport system permease protein
MFTGFDALGLVLLIGVLAGISVVTQTQLWLSKLGQTGMLGSLVVAVIVNEIAPLLVNFVVLGRSGTAIATELANMKVHDEIHILEAQGIDPMQYLVMPRTIGVATSVFCLAVFFSTASFLSGFLFSVLIEAGVGDFTMYARNIMGAVAPSAVLSFAVKTFLTGTIVGATCCVQGLNAGSSATETPQAVTRSVVKSIAIILTISVLVSIMTYT